MQKNNPLPVRNMQIMSKNCQSDYKNLDSYAEYLLANLCIPTLLKNKASSLLHLNKLKIKKMELFLQLIDEKIRRFESRSYILYENPTMVILLIYNEELLQKILYCKQNESFLTSFGYEMKSLSIDSVFMRIKERYSLYKDNQTEYNSKMNTAGKTVFPHEIGIILGYPRWDVEDFIRHQGRNYILCGYWKVYHEREYAMRIFDNYKKMRDYTLAKMMEGKTLQEIYDNN